MLEQLEDRHLLATALNIIPGLSGDGDQDANLLADGQILFADPDTTNNTVTTGALAALAANQDIVLEAETITFKDLAGPFTLTTEVGSTVTISTDTAGGGAITFEEVANLLSTSGASLTFNSATSATLGNLNSDNGATSVTAGGELAVESITTTAGANVSLLAGSNIAVNGDISADGSLDISNGATGTLTLGAGVDLSALGGDLTATDVTGILLDGSGSTTEISADTNVSLADIDEVDASGIALLRVESSSGDIVLRSADLDNGSAQLEIEAIDPSGSVTFSATSIPGKAGVEFDATNEPNTLIFDAVVAAAIAVTTDGGDITFSADINQPGGLAFTATTGDINLTTNGGTVNLEDAHDAGAAQPEDANAWSVLRTLANDKTVLTSAALNIGTADLGFNPPTLGPHPQIEVTGTITLGAGATGLAIGDEAVLSNPGASPFEISDAALFEISSATLQLGDGTASEARFDMASTYGGGRNNAANIIITAAGPVDDNDAGAFAFQSLAGSSDTL